MIQKSRFPVNDNIEQVSIIKFSFFYNKSSWHKLVRECLCPLLDRLEESNAIANYLLAFSFELGEHVRLTCWVNIDLEYAVRTCVKRHVVRWLKANPSSLPSYNSEVAHLWMNFNNNSVHINTFVDYSKQLHNIPSLSKKGGISTAISYQLINYLCDENTFDTEDILSKAITLAVCTVENYISNDCLYIVTDLIRVTNQNSEIAELGEISISSIIDDFNENRQFVMDYYQTLLDGEVSHTDKYWQNFVKEYIADSKDYLYKIVEIIGQTNLCLGLGPAMQTYVLIFLQQFIILYIKEYDSTIRQSGANEYRV